MQQFSIIVYTPAGPADPQIAIAASRANATGVLNLEYTRDVQAAHQAISKLSGYTKSDFGIKLDTTTVDFSIKVLEEKPDRLSTIILTASDLVLLREQVCKFHNEGLKILLECTNVNHARMGMEAEVDGLGGSIDNSLTLAWIGPNSSSEYGWYPVLGDAGGISGRTLLIYFPGSGGAGSAWPLATNVSFRLFIQYVKIN